MTVGHIFAGCSSDMMGWVKEVYKALTARVTSLIVERVSGFV